MYQKTAAPTETNRTNGAGWKARHDLANAKIARERDPRTYLKRRIRAKMAELSAATQRAHNDYAAMHRPVASGLPAQVHPTVAAKLAALLREEGLEGRDLSRPLVDDSHVLQEMIAANREAVEADHREAVADLARIEREAAEQAMIAAQVRLAKVTETFGTPEPIEPAVPEPARRGRPPKVASVVASETP